MDTASAIQAALVAHKASTTNLQRVTAERAEVKKALDAAMRERSEKELELAMCDEGDSFSEEALQAAVDEATQQVAETLRAYRKLTLSYKTTKAAAEQAENGNVWQTAFAVAVDEHLAGLREQMLARFDGWTVPETLDADALEADFRSMIRGPPAVPPPLVPIAPDEVPVEPTVDMDIATTTESLRLRRGLNARHLSSCPPVTEGGYN